MSVDLDEILSNYLKNIEAKYPNPQNDPYVAMNLNTIKISVRYVSIC